MFHSPVYDALGCGKFMFHIMVVKKGILFTNDMYPLMSDGDVLVGLNNFSRHFDIVCHHWIHIYTSGIYLQCIDIGSVSFLKLFDVF